MSGAFWSAGKPLPIKPIIRVRLFLAEGFKYIQSGGVMRYKDAFLLGGLRGNEHLKTSDHLLHNVTYFS